jgi:hypothetical protein
LYQRYKSCKYSEKSGKRKAENGKPKEFREINEIRGK